VTRPLTFNNNNTNNFNKQSNRDYTNSQHNNYNSYNRDYNTAYRNYGNSNQNQQPPISNPPSNNNYQQQQAVTNQSNHHRVHQNNKSFNSSTNQLSSSNNSNHSNNSTSVSAGGTLGARPLEANQTKQQTFNVAPITQSNTGNSQQQLTRCDSPTLNTLNNDKSFSSSSKKWIPPSRNDNQTQDDRNNIVFRRIRGILNKITPDKFSKLSDELLLCELDSPAILKGVVVLIFNKALEEPKYSSMYAQLCRKISEGAKNFEYENPDYKKSGPHDNTFCKYLLAKCQHEFNNRCQASEAFGEGPLSEEDEERRDQAKKMMLGNIKFICELGKQNLADEAILHRCIVQLCKKKANTKHTVEDLECLCQIMKTVGKLLDTERGKSLMDQYFSRMEKYANGNELPLRIKFKIQDVLDLRKNKWVPRTIQFDQNPKTLGQIREEATKDYSFLQPGGSIMGSFSMNQFPGAGGASLNVRGSSSYGQQQQSIFQVSGQRAIDDLFGANLPSFGAASSSSNNSGNSFEKYENSGTGGSKQQYSSGGNENNNFQPPRRVISNQQQPSNMNINNMNNNSRQPMNNKMNTKMNDMSSSSSNSSLRDDEQQMNIRNQQQDRSSQPQQYYNQGGGGYNRNQQQHTNQNYHDSRPMNNNRFNNQNNNYQNPNYQNRNNSGERMNNKMSNMNIRGDQAPANRELPPRFQKIQQQYQTRTDNRPLQNLPQQQMNRNMNQPNMNNMNRMNPHQMNNPNQYQGGGRGPQQNSYINNNPMNQHQNNSPMNIPQNQNKLINPVPNFQAMDSKDISLRPAKNFFSMKPPSLGQPGATNPIGANRLGGGNNPDSMNEQDRNQLNKPIAGQQSSINKPTFEKPTVAAIQQKIEQQQKDQKEDYLNKVNDALSKLLEKEIDDAEALKRIKELKTTKVTKNQLLVHLMKYGLDKSEQEREQVTKFVSKFKQEDHCTVDDYVAAFKEILSAMRDLEVDVPKVKSFVAVYIAQALSDEIIDLNQAFDLTVKTIYYPLFLLCLQYLGQQENRQQWLIKKFNDSKLDLMQALPEIDRNKERLSEVLRDRQLNFLYPLLRIESELMKQVNSGTDISPKQLYTWIKENVDSELQKSEGFIITLFTCIAKYVTEKTKVQVTDIEKEEASNTDKRIIELQKDILSKYAQIFQSFLLDHQNLQLALLYALQTYCHKLNFPKGMIFRWFIMLYDLEIVDSEVFLKWKEEVNDEYPSKGKALFQVNTWLNWLEKAEQDEEEEDE